LISPADAAALPGSGSRLPWTAGRGRDSSWTRRAAGAFLLGPQMRARSRLTSIGKKSLMAASGLLLALFVVAHLAGNLLVFDPAKQAGNDYARWLREHPGMLWSARAGLLAIFVLHVALGVRLAAENRRARPTAYARLVPVRSSLASRTMLLTGVLLLLFVLYHLAHFTFGWTQPAIEAAHAAGDWHRMMVLGFQDPLVSSLYLAAMVGLGLHLAHGLSSLFQTFGLQQRRLVPVVRRAGPLLGFLIAALFGAIPIAIQLRIVTP
jgi:succinate dehydrogenase / fumarate reductase cytochrome b subunit